MILKILRVIMIRKKMKNQLLCKQLKKMFKNFYKKKINVINQF